MTSSNKYSKVRLTIEVTICLFFMAFMWVFMEFCLKRPDGCSDKELVEIGGCDASGLCGVRFSDGTRGEVRLPVKGFGYTVCPKVQK